MEKEITATIEGQVTKMMTGIHRKVEEQVVVGAILEFTGKISQDSSLGGEV